jgi:hypothetical protein
VDIPAFYPAGLLANGQFQTKRLDLCLLQGTPRLAAQPNRTINGPLGAVQKLLCFFAERLGHGAAPFLCRRERYPVSQPPTPTGNAAAGDTGVVAYAERCKSLKEKPARPYFFVPSEGNGSCVLRPRNVSGGSLWSRILSDRAIASRQLLISSSCSPLAGR